MTRLIKEEFINGLESLSWMSSTTRAAARVKVRWFVIKAIKYTICLERNWLKATDGLGMERTIKFNCGKQFIYLSGDQWGNISNTRDSVSSGYLNTEKRVENTTCSGEFLTRLIRGVWIAHETLSRVCDVSSQSKQNLRSEWRSKIVKLYAGIQTSFTVVIFFVLTCELLMHCNICNFFCRLTLS